MNYKISGRMTGFGIFKRREGVAAMSRVLEEMRKELHGNSDKVAKGMLESGKLNI